MEIQPDFKELLRLFNALGVEYIVVGGYALAFHGAPRNTGDIDLLVKPDRANAERIVKALSDFGFASLELRPADFTSADRVVQLGVPPVRIDLVTSISGVSWDEANSGKVPASYAEIPINYIGRRQLIANKRATGRMKDKADLEALGE